VVNTYKETQKLYPNKKIVVVSLGDLGDSSYYSKHPRKAKFRGATDEIEVTRDVLKKWFKKFPDLKVCIGNHDERIYLRADEIGISAEWLPDYNWLYKAPDTVKFAKSHIIDNVVYWHGTGVSGNGWQNLALRKGMSSVIGHLHSKLGVVYRASSDRLLFSAVSGSLVDHDHPLMEYGSNYIEKPIVSLLRIVDGREVHTIPMNL
jgi:hypothetical protein